MDHLMKTSSSSSSMGDCSSPSSGNEEDDLRRGPWTVEEDLTLMNYIARHGEGRWNSLATSAGLKRTGKSCRLRWLNYLRPDVRRGNITLKEQLLILELHSQWGNRWSKIAQYLPGRTDNEIKNYWRTRVQKQAKQLNCDVNSKQFKDTMHYLWMPRLLERIQATDVATGSPEATISSSVTTSINSNYHSDLQNHHNIDIDIATKITLPSQPYMADFGNYGSIQVNRTGFTPETSSAAGSTDSFGGTQVVSPISDLNDCYNYASMDYSQSNNFSGYGDSLTSSDGYFNPGLDCQLTDQNNLRMDDGNVSSCLWNMDDYW